LYSTAVRAAGCTFVAGQAARFAYTVHSTVAHVLVGLSYNTNTVRSDFIAVVK